MDVVSDRTNVSRKTLEKHYDKRTEEVKVEQRHEYIEELKEAINCRLLVHLIHVDPVFRCQDRWKFDRAV